MKKFSWPINIEMANAHEWTKKRNPSINIINIYDIWKKFAAKFQSHSLFGIVAVLTNFLIHFSFKKFERNFKKLSALLSVNS